jgi:hypothetical protein
MENFMTGILAGFGGQPKQLANDVAESKNPAKRGFWYSF